MIMENAIQIDIDKIDKNFISDLKKNFKNKAIKNKNSEIRVLDDNELLSNSETMLSRINEARSRKGGLSLEEVEIKYFN